MKTFMASLFLLMTMTSALAQGDSFVSKHRSLREVLQALRYAQNDFPSYYSFIELPFENPPIGPEYTCYETQGDELVVLFEKAFENYQRFYPDEILPYEKALEEVNELRDLNFKKCERFYETETHQVHTQLFLGPGKINFRVDFLR